MPDASKDQTKSVPMYCVRCRAMTIVSGPKLVDLKNHRRALKGICPHCGTHTFKIVSSKDPE